MRIWSYVGARYEDGAWTGVPRFDHDLRKVFPDMQSVTTLPKDLDPGEDLVITDNHLSVDVPDNVKTIVVHHGCALTHWERDSGWRGPQTAELVRKQEEMFRRPNRIFVAPSEWVRREFIRHYKLPENYATVIPHHVKPFGPIPARSDRSRPVVIGDWRTQNKGSLLIKRIQEAAPDFEFRQLKCTPETRQQFYLDGDIYLCLSLSEGAPYAVADAEACGMRIVSSNVGYCHEFGSVGLSWMNWEQMSDLDVVKLHLSKARKMGRDPHNFFQRYTFLDWRNRWDGLVSRTMLEVPPSRQMMKRKTVAVSLGGGIGNSLFNLPLLRALDEMDVTVIGYVSTDAPTAELWRRCKYLDQVVEAPAPPPKAEYYVAGPCSSPSFDQATPRRYKYSDEQNYRTPEWALNLRAAQDLGWDGSEKESVSEWCRGLETKKVYDVGIVPGCKPGIWERKRYPKMHEVAQQLLALGLKVAVFGTEQDRPSPEIPGDDLIAKYDISELPEALASCKVLLATDNGIGHLGASLGIPTVMIFTATSPMKGRMVPAGSRNRVVHRLLECQPCQSSARWQSCSNWICREIPPETIVRETVELFEEASMLSGENIQVVTSEGAECFVCDKGIDKGARSVQIQFKLMVKVKKEMHQACAVDLQGILKLKAIEAAS